jgi:hypothetical protein
MESDKMNGIEINCARHGGLTVVEIVTPMDMPFWIRCRDDNQNPMVYLSHGGFPLFNANFQVCPGDAMTIKSELGRIQIKHRGEYIFELWHDSSLLRWERYV